MIAVGGQPDFLCMRQTLSNAAMKEAALSQTRASNLITGLRMEPEWGRHHRL